MDFTYTGLSENENGLWKVKKGKVDFGYTGFIKDNGDNWYVRNGKIRKNYSGMVRVKSDAWLIKNGQVDTEAVGKFTGTLDGIKDEYLVSKGKIIGHPFGWPVLGPVPYGFGPRNGRAIVAGASNYHKGIDITVDSGTPVRAAKEGVVSLAKWYYGYGNAVIIDHGNGFQTLYGHNSKINVKVGDKVKRGDIVAYAGSTGISSGPHVHFGVRYDNNYVDPALFMDGTERLAETWTVASK